MENNSKESENFADIETVKIAIKKFQKLGWPEFKENDDIEKFIQTISTQITSELGKFPNFLMLLKPRDFPFGIFRVREVTESANFNLFTEHSYPPAAFTKLGRCNFPKHPVFYGSNNPVTALAEVVRESDYKGKRFCISSWEINSRQTFVFENFLQSPLHPKNTFDLLAKALIEKVSEPFDDLLPIEQKEGITEFLKYIDSQFINDKGYSLSASFAHRRIYGNHNLCTDILMYPSVQTLMQGVNFAINPNFVDNHMRVKRFYIVELQSYDEESGQFALTFHKYGDIKKNVIFWKNLDPKDKQYQKNVKLDFKSFIKDDFKFEFTK
ncbi:RES domain-containing protein [Flavobacterium sp. 270]|uniref:RES domain-containing protein n=1 Tax=Flavobacterium sp. 270 TaxID=2512114 RepID=UPI00141707E2|nr:RES domain-containing protein [Flavobacterium sp. 270]